MSSFYFIYAVAGLITATIGLGMLWYSWVNKKKSLPLIILGWSIILLSLVLWAYAGGADRGTAMGLMALGVLALGFVFVPAFKKGEVRRKKISRPVKVDLNEQASKSSKILKNTGLFFLLFLICGITSLISALGIYEILLFSSVELSTGLVWALFLFPCLWTALAIHMLMSKKWKNKIMVLLGCVSFGVIMMVVGN